MKSSVAIWCALLSVGCSDTVMSPTVLPTNPDTALKLRLPDPAPAVEGTPSPVPGVTPPPSGAGSTSAHTLCQHIKHGVSCEVQAFTDDFVTVRFTNRGTLNSESVTLSSYTLGPDVDSFAAQRVFKHAPTALLGAGEWADLLVWLPRCNFQVDAYTGPKVNHPPHANVTLLGFEKRTNRGPCEAPPIDPPVDPLKSPPRQSLTDCRDGVEKISFLWSGDTATATFRIRPDYEVSTLWFGGYERLDDGWENQRFLGGVPPKTYTPGTYAVTVPAVPVLNQSDAWCGGADLYGADVTPANIQRFNAIAHFYVLSPDGR